MEELPLLRLSGSGQPLRQAVRLFMERRGWRGSEAAGHVKGRCELEVRGNTNIHLPQVSSPVEATGVHQHFAARTAPRLLLTIQQSHTPTPLISPLTTSVLGLLCAGGDIMASTPLK